MDYISETCGYDTPNTPDRCQCKGNVINEISRSIRRDTVRSVSGVRFSDLR